MSGIDTAAHATNVVNFQIRRYLTDKILVCKAMCINAPTTNGHLSMTNGVIGANP